MNKPTPAKGVNEQYDQQLQVIDCIKEELESYLIKVRLRVKENGRDDEKIRYFHSPMCEYQIEIPEAYVSGGKKPVEFEFTSKRKGFQRFQTQELKHIVFRLSQAKDTLRQHLAEFAREIFKRFKYYSEIWNLFVRILSTLDTLQSLHDFSYGDPLRYNFPFLTLPEFLEYEDIEKEDDSKKVSIISQQTQIIQKYFCTNKYSTNQNIMPTENNQKQEQP